MQPLYETIGELEKKSYAVMRMGVLALSSGCGGYGVKDFMKTVAAFLGIENQAHVTLTEISSTCRFKGYTLTRVHDISTVGVNVDRIYELEKLAYRIKDNKELPIYGIKKDKPLIEEKIVKLPLFRKIRKNHNQTVSENNNYNDERLDWLNRQLDKIEVRPILYDSPLIGVLTAMACAGISLIIGLNVPAAICAFIGGAFGQTLRWYMSKKYINQFAGIGASVVLAGVVYILSSNIISFLMPGVVVAMSGYVASMIFIIPGFPMLTGALDLAKLDFSSGVERILYAITVLLVAGFAVWVVAGVTGFVPVQPIDMASPEALQILFFTIASFFGTIGFAFLFGCPVFLAFVCGILGALANVIYFTEIRYINLPQAAAALFAALITGVISNYFSVKRHIPRLAFSVSIAVIMVPGAALYNTLYYINIKDINMGIFWLFQVTTVLCAVALGLVLAHVLTDREWTFDNDKVKPSGEIVEIVSEPKNH
ncbi:MAG: threonine/serine exporter family protein [Bifidobacteriaceae bacterium]|jgi:uncharacterized membrane protein YjjP (DUF1212 family)|nr:threonine/serine exporter family protein [Bifidobacteriaceae bacterium]